MPCTNPKSGIGGIDAAARSGDAVAKVRGVASEEVELMAGEQGKTSVGPLDQELVERPGGAVPVAGQPPLDRGLVRGLREESGRARPARDAEARAPGRSGTSVERQRQVGRQGVAHGEVGLLGDELGRQRDDVRVVADEPIDRRGRRCGRLR